MGTEASRKFFVSIKFYVCFDKKLTLLDFICPPVIIMPNMLQLGILITGGEFRSTPVSFSPFNFQARVLFLVHGPGQIQNSWSKKDQSWCYNLSAPPPPPTYQHKYECQKTRKMTTRDVMLYQTNNQPPTNINIKVKRQEKGPEVTLCYLQMNNPPIRAWLWISSYSLIFKW